MKRLSLVLLLLCLITAMTFANGKDDGAADETIELTLYMARDVTAPDAGMWDELVASFEEAHPNVTIVPEFLFGEPYHQKLKAMAVGDSLPDLIWLWPGKRTAMVTDNGLAHDLRADIADIEGNFASVAMAPQGPNNELYQLPEDVVVTSVMYTNNRILDELGLSPARTIDEMIAQVPVIRDAGYLPLSMANGDNWEIQSCLLGTLIERFGGQAWYDSAVTNGGAQFTDQPFIDALEMINTLYNEGVFHEGINSMDYATSGQLFLQEEAVYYLDGSWKVNEMATTFTDEQKSYISLEPFPEVPGQVGASGSASAVPGPGFGINSDLTGLEYEMALAWVRHYSGEAGSRIRLSKGASPAYSLPLDEFELDPMVVKYQEFLAQYPTTYVLDNKMDGEGVGILQNGIQEMMLGLKTVDEVANEYQAWVVENDSSRQ